MRFIFLASIILSFYTNSIDAQKLDITLLDSTTNEPVSYAHISILNNKTGTYSNEKGQFALNLDGLPLKIEISHLSYNRKKIDIDNSSNTIIFYLTPSVTMLPEISVANISTAGVLRKVWEKNNAQIESSYLGKSFYRQISITDDSLFTEVHEVFYDLLFTNQGITKWKLNQGRFAKQHYFKTTKGKEEKVVGERNFSSLSKIAKMFYTGPRGPLFPIGKNVELLFEVEVTDIFTKEGESFLKVYCKPKKIVQSIPVFEGTYIIRESDYSIFSFNGSMTHPYGIDKTLGKDYQTKNYLVEINLEYGHDKNTLKSYLRHVKVKGKFDYLNKRFGKWHNLYTNSDLFVYQYNEQVSEDGMLENNKSNLWLQDIDMIKKLEYNQEFWLQNQIIKRTPLEEKIVAYYEKNRSFEGKLFTEN